MPRRRDDDVLSDPQIVFFHISLTYSLFSGRQFKRIIACFFFGNFVDRSAMCGYVILREFRAALKPGRAWKVSR